MMGSMDTSRSNNTEAGATKDEVGAEATKAEAGVGTDTRAEAAAAAATATAIKEEAGHMSHGLSPSL